MGSSEPRKVVVTGVSRGLGRAMAEEFMARGHAVAGCVRSAKALEELKRFASPPNHFAVLDVTDAGVVHAWAEKVLREFGVPDLLVNNAGVKDPNNELWKVSPADFSRVIDTNIKGVFHVIHAFVPAMIKQQRGVIVNFSSGWGRSTAAGVAPYCASKWAIEGLSQALAQELPAGMAAVALNPGIIDTDMLRSTFGDSAATFPKPEAWAKRAVPFLLELKPEHTGRPLTVPGAATD